LSPELHESENDPVKRETKKNVLGICMKSYHYNMDKTLAIKTQSMKVGKVCVLAHWTIRSSLISGFHSMKLLGVFLLPPGWDGSLSQGYLPILNSPVPMHLYTWVGRGTARVKCLAQEHDTVSQGSSLDCLI